MYTERILLTEEWERRRGEERMRTKLAQFSNVVTVFAMNDEVFGDAVRRDYETELYIIEEGDQEEDEEKVAKEEVKEERKEDVTEEVKEASADSSSSTGYPGRRAGKEKVQEEEDDTPDKPDGPLFARKYLIFRMRLTQSNFNQGSSLFIPVEITLDNYFLRPPPKCNPQNWEEKIGISSTQGDVWYVKVGYSRNECGFLIDSEWWQGFYALHGLKAKDVIGFYGDRDCLWGKSILGKHHYLIEKEAYKSTRAMFKRENFEFQWLLSEENVVLGWLYVDEEIVREYFPNVRIPGAETHYKERLYFTDNHNREWCVLIIFAFSTYMLHLEQFLKKCKAKEGDILRFFKPVEPLTSRHYLIQHLQKQQPGTSNPTPPQPLGGGGTSNEDKQVKIGDKAAVTETTSSKQAQLGTGKEHVKRVEHVKIIDKASGMGSSSSKQAQLGSNTGKEHENRNDHEKIRYKVAGSGSSSSKESQSGTSARKEHVQTYEHVGTREKAPWTGSSGSTQAQSGTSARKELGNEDELVKIREKDAGTGSSSSKDAQLGISTGKEHVKSDERVKIRDKAARIGSSSPNQAQSDTSARKEQVRRDDEAEPSGTRRDNDDRSRGEPRSGSRQGKKTLFAVAGCCMPLHGRKRSDGSSD